MNNHKNGTSVCMLICFSHVQLFVTLGTIAHQAPLAMGLSSKNTGVGYHAFLQGIFLTPGSNSCLFSLALIDGFFTTGATWEAPWMASSVSFWNIHSIHLEN